MRSRSSNTLMNPFSDAKTGYSAVTARSRTGSLSLRLLIPVGLAAITVAVFSSFALLRGQSAAEAVGKHTPIYQEFDFGTVMALSTNSHRFRVQNDSQLEWHVSSVETGCVCALASPVQSSVVPGQTLDIDLRYIAPIQTGRDVRAVVVRLEEQQAPTIHLKVKSQVRQPLTALPARLDISVPYEQSGQGVIEVENYSDFRWDGIEVRASVPWLMTNVAELSPGEGALQRYHVVASTVPGQFHASDDACLVTIAVQSEKAQNEVPLMTEVYVRARKPSLIDTQPKRLFFGSVGPGASVSKSVFLQVPKDFSLTSEDCIFSVSGPLQRDISLEKVEAVANGFLFSVRFSDSTRTPGIRAGEVIVGVVLHGQPLSVAIPLSARIVDHQDSDATDSASALSGAADPDSVCGPRCVQRVLEYYSKKADLIELVKETQHPVLETGATLHSLVVALKSRGLFARAVTTGGATPFTSRCPAILHCVTNSGEGHFILYLPGASGSEGEFWDGLKGSARHFPAYLAFSGNAVLVASTEFEDDVAVSPIPWYPPIGIVVLLVVLAVLYWGSNQRQKPSTLSTPP